MSADKKSEIDLFDFDKTCLPFDSGSAFSIYCLFRYPYAAICLPYQFVGALKYFFGKCDMEELKAHLFSYVPFVPVEKAVCDFWDMAERFIYPWAKQENRQRISVIVSASPDFLLKEISARLNFDGLICTRHDKIGSVIGKNCRGTEKVLRVREEYPDSVVVNVFSDSIKHDFPIFNLSENAYLVKCGKLKTLDINNLNGGKK